MQRSESVNITPEQYEHRKKKAEPLLHTLQAYVFKQQTEHPPPKFVGTGAPGSIETWAKGYPSAVFTTTVRLEYCNTIFELPFKPNPHQLGTILQHVDPVEGEKLVAHMHTQRAIQELAKAQLSNEIAQENKPLSEMTDEEIEERLARRKAAKAEREAAAIAAADSLLTPTPPSLKITMPPKRQRTEEPEWLAWALDTDNKESSEAHYHPDQHGAVCAHGNTAELKQFVSEGPWCSEWWIWRRIGGVVSYFKTREDNLRKELSQELSKLKKTVTDLGLQVQGAAGKAAFSPPPPPAAAMTPPQFGSGNTAGSVIAVDEPEKRKIDFDSECMRREFLLAPNRLTELDVRYILYFKELLENKFVVIDKNKICIEYPRDRAAIPDL
ncbi:hypothetical protein CYMTET_8549 [Cymbomonas tetramitiformis]|uniref:Uncharacterized protein n=1 Tax=Cymbomonas tetramitiformis TaxID=36881 RepID=A0AAE0GSX5_9CHLO|nr:hypothetical protein CYMTET_8549 [Cymbomonas tetramitiformis]